MAFLIFSIVLLGNDSRAVLVFKITFLEKYLFNFWQDFMKNETQILYYKVKYRRLYFKLSLDVVKRGISLNHFVILLLCLSLAIISTFSLSSCPFFLQLRDYNIIHKYQNCCISINHKLLFLLSVLSVLSYYDIPSCSGFGAQQFDLKW